MKKRKNFRKNGTEFREKSAKKRYKLVMKKLIDRWKKLKLQEKPQKCSKQ